MVEKHAMTPCAGRRLATTEEKPAPTKRRSSRASTNQTASTSRRGNPGLPGAGQGLPPTALRLLEAARRLLARSGYNSLSVEAIGREAGENKALIRYYFGSKKGLLVALVDWLVADSQWQSRQRLSGRSRAQGPSQVVTGTSKAMLDDSQSYLLFFDLLPRLLEDPAMAKQLAELYRAYRDQNTRPLWDGRAGDPPETVRDLGVMTVALTDGLAVQILAEPGSVEVSRVLALWASFVDEALASLSTEPV